MHFCRFCYRNITHTNADPVSPAKRTFNRCFSYQNHLVARPLLSVQHGTFVPKHRASITHNKPIKNHRPRWTREEGRMSVFESEQESEKQSPNKTKVKSERNWGASGTVLSLHRVWMSDEYARAHMRTCRGSSVRAAVIKYPIYHCHLSALPAGTETM